jgi:hypothetical protein
MPETQLEELRQRVHQLALEAMQQGEPSAWFETMYAEAGNDATQIPWAKMNPHPILSAWLNSPKVSGEGKKAFLPRILFSGIGLGKRED